MVPTAQKLLADLDALHPLDREAMIGAILADHIDTWELLRELRKRYDDPFSGDSDLIDETCAWVERRRRRETEEAQ